MEAAARLVAGTCAAATPDSKCNSIEQEQSECCRSKHGWMHPTVTFGAINKWPGEEDKWHAAAAAGKGGVLGVTSVFQPAVWVWRELMVLLITLDICA